MNYRISTEPGARLRIDKWLWAARFFKTRSLAADAVDVGQALQVLRADVGDDGDVGQRHLGKVLDFAVVVTAPWKNVMPGPLHQRKVHFADVDDAQRKIAFEALGNALGGRWHFSFSLREVAKLYGVWHRRISRAS